MNIFQTISTELKYIKFAFQLVKRAGRVDNYPMETVADLIEDQVKKNENKTAIEFEDKKYTYKELDEEANKVAHWAISKGFKKGDVVSLLMENRPEFIFIWYGFAKIGGTVACLNSNIKSKSLAHCIQTSKSKSIIVGSELIDNYSSAHDLLDDKLPVYVDGKEVQGYENISPDDFSNKNPGSLMREGLINTESLFYIYTSGTTGLPKASRFSHAKFTVAAGLAMFTLHLKPSDRNYMVLPLYHATGGIVGVASTFFSGATLILRRKFSVEKFWEDCVKYKITTVTYIGEMLRYLATAKESPYEKQHQIRGIFGNGLRPDVWKVFEERFNISNIIEFYGSSEGNISTCNVDSKFGAIGRIPPYLAKKLNTKIVKFDVENEQIVRNSEGYCIECEADEAGEAIGQIPDENTFTGRFEGYTDEKASNKKILRDVFEKGDRWFSSGDLLKKDKKGYFYFVDRIGDTFRWKSENVATSEVSEAMSTFPKIKEVNVYGVLVPKQDGRAGMASIVVDDDFSIDGLYEHLQDQLPKYSVPLFIRISEEIEKTGTFKYKKVDLAKEGFDPEKISDQLYFASMEDAKYINLDKDLFSKINNQEVRV